MIIWTQDDPNAGWVSKKLAKPGNEVRKALCVRRLEAHDHLPRARRIAPLIPALARMACELVGHRQRAGRVWRRQQGASL